MKLFSLIFISTLLLSSCGVSKTSPSPVMEPPKAESNTVDIGNKTITIITGSSVQPIR
jgi:hypothetical protein